jgi:galactokinase
MYAKGETMEEKKDVLIRELYGMEEQGMARLETLKNNFQQRFQSEQAEFFSAPGRTEIIGNHTDHNGGMVIAASIDKDTIAAAYPNQSDVVRIISEGYAEEITIDLSALAAIAKGTGTKSLVAGMMEAVSFYGYEVAGFDAYVSTNVIAAAGVSSSASFEMLICAIVNYFFNQQKMTYFDYARIGQYAENKYWLKASGLMDQMSCAVGGTILLDFSNKDQIGCQKMNFTFEQSGYSLVIVNTGKSHANLSHEYSDVPLEMKQAASVLGVDLLGESNLNNLLEHICEIKNDRATLRALHFYEENRRVQRAVVAIDGSDAEELLRLMDESGTSSWELLQNCYSLEDCKEQKIPLALAISRLFLNQIGAGMCRVHGGGFAGVIMCMVPTKEKMNYVNYISRYVGKENVYPMNIRKVGAVHIRF